MCSLCISNLVLETSIKCFHPVRKTSVALKFWLHTYLGQNMKTKVIQSTPNPSSKVYNKYISKKHTPYEPSSGIICKAKVQVLKLARLPRPFIALLKLRRSALRQRWSQIFTLGFPGINTKRNHGLHQKKRIFCEWCDYIFKCFMYEHQPAIFAYTGSSNVGLLFERLHPQKKGARRTI